MQTLDRFLRAYPNHPNSDYALYLKALATPNERDGWLASMTRQDIAFRDAQAARDAFDIFKELAGRYPDSRYAPEARRRMHERSRRCPSPDHDRALYFERKAYIACINRAKIVITDYQQTPMRDEALQLLADSYHELGMFDLERDTRRIIEANKPAQTSMN